MGTKITSSLYTIDFEEGVFYFTAPDQIQSVNNAQKKHEIQGWILSFHPDLIRNTALGKTIDNHSQEVICSYLELLLNLSKRYYERQFNTRSAQHSDLVSRFQSLIKDYYERGMFREQGTPSMEYFAEKVLLSANYLSDLLKKETGYSGKDQINHFIIEKAKTLLLSEPDSVSGIAYTLGFNYPHYFSRMFKSKTGMTPQEYRQLN